MNALNAVNARMVSALKDLGISLEDTQLMSAQDLCNLEELPELLEMMSLDLSLDSALRQQIGVVLSLYRDNKLMAS